MLPRLECFCAVGLGMWGLSLDCFTTSRMFLGKQGKMDKTHPFRSLPTLLNFFHVRHTDRVSLYSVKAIWHNPLPTLVCICCEYPTLNNFMLNFIVFFFFFLLLFLFHIIKCKHNLPCFVGLGDWGREEVHTCCLSSISGNIANDASHGWADAIHPWNKSLVQVKVEPVSVISAPVPVALCSDSRNSHFFQMLLTV